MSEFARSFAALALAGALQAGSLCIGGDIAADSGIQPGQDLSGRSVSVDKEDAAKAEAMALFSEAYLKSSSRGSLDRQGIDLLFKAAELDPDSPELIRDIVSELAKSGSLAKSLDRLGELALRHPGSPSMASIVSDVLEGEGRRASAVQVLSKAFDAAKDDESSWKDPALPGLISKLALLKAVSGDLDASCDVISWAMKRPPLAGSMQLLQAAMAVYSMGVQQASPDRPWWGLGLVDSEAESFKGKLKELSDSFVSAALDSKEPFNAMLYQAAIGVLKGQGRLDDARKILLNGLLASPNDKEALSTLARVSYDLKDYANSCRFWRMALRNGLRPTAVVYSSYALALREAGLLEEAANVYEWQMLLDSGNKASALQLALTYLELGRVDKCLSRLEELKGEYSAMYLKAVCLDRLKRRAEALDALLKSEALAEGAERRILDERSYRMLRASFAEKARRADIVKASVQPLIDKDANDYEALNFLGYTLADLNSELDFSESCIRKALAGDPGNAAYLDSMAWVLYRKGSYKESRLWIEKALKASEGSVDGVIADHAGDIYAALGDTAKALKSWQEALDAPASEELEPDRVKAKIEALKSCAKGGGLAGK